MEQNLALLWALTSLVFVSSITPGPNNLMLMSSGMRFGLRRSLPHLAGVTVGFAILLAASFLGLGALFERYPLLEPTLAVACAAYLGYLALKLLAADSIDGNAQPAAARRPIGFVEAALFQWINPKAWSMAVAAAALMAQAEMSRLSAGALLVAVDGVVGLPCTAVWAAFGARLRGALARPGVDTAVRCAMALLLIVSAAWMLAPLDIHWPQPQLHAELPELAIGR